MVGPVRRGVKLPSGMKFILAPAAPRGKYRPLIFFDTAEKTRIVQGQDFRTDEDLRLLDDITLIDTCARVDLLSDVNPRKDCGTSNYMRKPCKAPAHPKIRAS